MVIRRIKMANIKSAKKRIGVNEAKRERNTSKKSAIKTATKKFKNALEAKELELATELLKEVTSLLDSAAQDNIIHKNKAARDKAKFSSALQKATNSK